MFAACQIQMTRSDHLTCPLISDVASMISFSLKQDNIEEDLTGHRAYVHGAGGQS